MVEPNAARGDATGLEKVDRELRQPAQVQRVEVVITAADIGMDQRRVDADERPRGFVDLTDDQVAFRRHRFAMRLVDAIEGDDAPARQPLAKMIVGASVA